MIKWLMLFTVCLGWIQAEEVKEAPKEEFSETTHTVNINGKPLNYKAIAGTYLLKDAQGKGQANIFYVAYTKEGVEKTADRPVTFCFNGGPGSSSIWLHMGMLGPVKVNYSDLNKMIPPFSYSNNEYSILDLTDLVFIDPVSTGYSRTVPGIDAKTFHGVDEDIKSVAEFIRLYITRNNRWDSKKYLAGESYGTTRAAGLANYLQDENSITLNGIVLVSSVLNLLTIDDKTLSGNDVAFALLLPSYTATAWYHKKLPADLQGDFAKALKESEEFALNEYSLALLKGDNLQGDAKKSITEKLARYTGLSADYLDKSYLRVPVIQYMKELLRDKNLVVGRFDGRYTGYGFDSCSQYGEYDPSLDDIAPVFASAFNQYIRKDLKWEKDENYNLLINVRPWNYGKAVNSYLSTAESLRQVMMKVPMMKVFVASGYYDMATPYLSANYTFDHMNLEPALHRNIDMKYYHAGHMMYLHPQTLQKLKSDLTNFFNTK